MFVVYGSNLSLARPIRAVDGAYSSAIPLIATALRKQ